MQRARWLLVLLLLVAGAPGRLLAAEQRAPITISADSLEVNRKARVAIYQGNVAANDRGRGLSILADRIEFYFDENMEEVQHATAAGNVRLSYGERRGVAERAEYFPGEDRAVLLGHPKVWQENDMVSGCRITLLLREDRSQVEGCDGERVNAVLYPKRDEEPVRGGTRR
ncbi:MAG: lipopolysaccharide transport periplasmic protein LptA [Candidatus Methylomirabilales bacterium]